jgi:hypothetical protein
MNVQLLPGALKEIDALLAAGYRGAGFLLGTAIGRFVLVERLLPLDFDSRGGGEGVCGPVFEKYGEGMQGVFFCRRRPFAADWLIGDLVLDVRPGRIAVLTCEFPTGGRGRRRARLVPLLEDADAEGTWRI